MGPSKWILDKIALFILKVSSHIRQEFIERGNMDALLSGLCVCVCVSSVVSTLCDPMDYSLPGSSVHGILKARILEWGAISFSRESSLSRDQTQVSCISCIGKWIIYQQCQIPVLWKVIYSPISELENVCTLRQASGHKPIYRKIFMHEDVHPRIAYGNKKPSTIQKFNNNRMIY